MEGTGNPLRALMAGRQRGGGAAPHLAARGSVRDLEELPISQSLRVATKRAWVDAVLGDFDTFLVDHAACERKAAATGMAFVVRYPDRRKLLRPCIAFAREELEHFERVYAILEARGLQLAPDTKDPYVVELGREVRSGSDDRLLDRLLVAGTVEQRGRERFGLLAAALDDEDLARLYTELMHAEARHHSLFLQLASLYFAPDRIGERLDQLLDAEAAIIDRLPIRSALH